MNIRKESLINTKIIAEKEKIYKEKFKEFYKTNKFIYECSSIGRFRRISKTAVHYLKPYLRYCKILHRKRKHTAIIKIDGKEFNCRKLIATLFIRPLQSNEVVILRNGNNLDLNVKNMFITTKSNLGRITGGKSSKARKICYCDYLGYKQIYSSARSLAKYLGISYQTVLNIAHGKTKNPKFNIKWCDNEENTIQNS